jgi:hypothetical protein
MTGVILGVLAVVFTVGVFMVEAGSRPGVSPPYALGYAMMPYLLAAIFLVFKKYRNSSGFFKVVAIISGMLFISGVIREAEKTPLQKAEKYAARGAEIINAKAPVMVDEITRLDKAVAEPGARLTVFYSFPEYAAQDIDRNKLLENMPSVRQKLCSNGETKAGLRQGVIYVLSYKGNDGVEIARFEVSKQDCGYLSYPGRLATDFIPV